MVCEKMGFVYDLGKKILVEQLFKTVITNVIWFLILEGTVNLRYKTF
jgi:hypothetical protein